MPDTCIQHTSLGDQISSPLLNPTPQNGSITLRVKTEVLIMPGERCMSCPTTNPGVHMSLTVSHSPSIPAQWFPCWTTDYFRQVPNIRPLQ